jgi:hypothetical protein
MVSRHLHQNEKTEEGVEQREELINHNALCSFCNSKGRGLLFFPDGCDLQRNAEQEISNQVEPVAGSQVAGVRIGQAGKKEED